MLSAIHPELLRSYSDGLAFYDFTGCDVDDIGRWMVDAFQAAMDSDDDDVAVQNFWFARACQFELRQRSRPIVRQ
jgi:hypothetical protein